MFRIFTQYSTRLERPSAPVSSGRICEVSVWIVVSLPGAGLCRSSRRGCGRRARDLEDVLEDPSNCPTHPYVREGIAIDEKQVCPHSRTDATAVCQMERRRRTTRRCMQCLGRTEARHRQQLELSM